jgi:hypothetical protein
MNFPNENLRLVFVVLDDKNVSITYYHKTIYKQKVLFWMFKV